jgi:hypothetical protein
MYARFLGTPALVVLGMAGALEGQVADPSLTMCPWSFEENRGQFDGGAAFVGRDGGMRTFVDRDAITLQLVSIVDEGTVRGVNVRLTFEGASPLARAEGLSKLPGIVNYFLGNDPAMWLSEIPTFASVAVRDLYPGIDLVVRGGRTGRLEYDLEVAPGADLEALKIRLEGQDGVSVLDERVLLLRTSLGSLRQDIPATWEILSDGTHRPLDARWIRHGLDRFGFEVPGRDPSLPLVIDPGLVWSTFLGGTNLEFAYAVALDATGAATIAGRAHLGFPTTPGAFMTTIPGTGNAFVSRISPTGSTLLYSTFLGGSYCCGSPVDEALTLAVDGTGAATIGGYTLSSNFPTTPGAYATSCGPIVWCGFVTRLSPNGASLLYPNVA